jgi:alkylation response protein AidB-like acyl-CoA dehydrogenase
MKNRFMRILPTSDESNALWKDILDFCGKTLPETTVGLERQGTMSDGDSPEFYRRLGQAGWIGCHWPEEYGGRGLRHLDTFIVDEALGYARAPLSGYLLSVKVFGNTLLLFGTEEQKREYLPKIASGEVTFCQGFSEPGAGSDFGSLRTVARREGDEFVISGHKIWTSSAEVAQCMYLAARTDPDAPKHRGISTFVMDMNLPGVTVNTFPTLGGGVLNEVFLDSVRIPAKNLIGELNRGFHQSMRSLDLERSAMDRIGSAWRALDDLAAYVQRDDVLVDGRPLKEQQCVREKIAELYSRLRAARLFGYQLARHLDADRAPSADFSYGKLFIGLLLQAVADATMEIIGPLAQFEHGAELAPYGGLPASLYRACPALTLAGGSSEIQKSVIAVRGLGLPK